MWRTVSRLAAKPSWTRTQSFVLMPQARRRHQPRAAWYQANAPEAANTKQSHRLRSQSSSPAMFKVTPHTARTIRPRRSMFRAKKLPMPTFSTRQAECQTACAGSTDFTVKWGLDKGRALP